MVSLDDVARMALELPEASEGERHGTLSWSVRGKSFAWERGFSKADLKRFGGTTPPEGPFVAVRVEDLGEKEAVLAAHPKAFFTFAHFEGYPAIMVKLNVVTKREMREALVDGWLACAPPSLAHDYVAKSTSRRRS